MPAGCAGDELNTLKTPIKRVRGRREKRVSANNKRLVALTYTKIHWGFASDAV